MQSGCQACLQRGLSQDPVLFALPLLAVHAQLSIFGSDLLRTLDSLGLLEGRLQEQYWMGMPLGWVACPEHVQEVLTAGSMLLCSQQLLTQTVYL